MVRRSTPRARGMWRWLLACSLGMAFASAAYGQVTLSLEPPDSLVSPGAVVELQLWARSTSAQPLDGAEVVLRWDPGQLALTGFSPGTPTYGWNPSGFPSASPMNATWDDGDALYQCLAPLGAVPPQTDIMLAILRFTASNNAAVATVSIPNDGDTLVASGGISILEAASGAVVQVGSSSDGSGGGATGGGGDGSSDGGSGDAGGGSTGDGGDSGDVPGDQGGDDGDNGSDNGSATGGDSQGSEGDSGTPPTRPVLTFPCGAGAIQGIVLSALVMIAGQRRGRRWMF